MPPAAPPTRSTSNPWGTARARQIGTASCRGRAQISAGAACLTKKIPTSSPWPAAAVDRLFFDVQTGVGTATWRLIDPFSNILFSTSFDTDVETLTITQPGTYTLALEGRRNASGSAAYTFNVQPVVDGSGT